MVKFDFSKNCYGCGICAQTCPVHAIEMVRDSYGFKMPEVNPKICCECGWCERACIHLNEHTACADTKARYFRASLLDCEGIAACTSGGIFRALAEECLVQGGCVCGCVWDEDFRAVHVLSDDRDTVTLMSGSKYVESDLYNVQTQVKEVLDSGRKVLFSGTPCQVASLRTLTGDRENLITIAVICSGVASPKAWHKYKEEIQRKAKSHLVRVEMRSKKRYGWDAPVSEYCFANGGKSQHLSYSTDPYVVPMLYGLFARNSCTCCAFKGDNIPADLIVGDHWGASLEQIRQNGNRGLSTVVIRTEKGLKTLDEASYALEMQEISEQDARRKNDRLFSPIEENPRKQMFFERLDETGYTVSLRRAVPNVWSKKIINLIFKAGVYGVYRKLKSKMPAS